MESAPLLPLMTPLKVIETGLLAELSISLAEVTAGEMATETT
jgi:hypothetical protein